MTSAYKAGPFTTLATLHFGNADLGSIRSPAKGEDRAFSLTTPPTRQSVRGKRYPVLSDS